MNDKMLDAVNEWLGMDRHSLEQVAILGALPGVSFDSAAVVAKRRQISLRRLERAIVETCRKAVAYGH